MLWLQREANKVEDVPRGIIFHLCEFAQIMIFVHLRTNIGKIRRSCRQ